MDIKEIKELRKEIEQAKEKLNETMYDVTESMEILRDQAEKLNKLDSQLSEEEFARWTESGFRVGARVRIDCVDVAQPVTVTGISAEGFMITTADGKKYPIRRSYLHLIDRFHMLPDNDSDFERPQTGDDQIYVKALREYMLKNGINQDELAERLQVSPAAVGKWLLGHNGITLRNRDKIRRLCGNFPGEEG